MGDITYIGQRDYSMRLWLDPEKMATRNLSANDVVSRHRGNKTRKWPPVKSASRRCNTGQTFQYTITTMGRLADPDEFADMILKSDAGGNLVRVRDVARIELGAKVTIKPAGSTANPRWRFRFINCPARMRWILPSACATKWKI